MAEKEKKPPVKTFEDVQLRLEELEILVANNLSKIEELQLAIKGEFPKK